MARKGLFFAYLLSFPGTILQKKQTMKTLSVFFILLLSVVYSAFGQSTVSRSREISLAATPNMGGSGIQYDLMYRWAASKENNWWTVNASSGYEFFSPGVYYRTDPQSVRSDSGRTVTTALRLGREWRNYVSDGAFVTTGVELGGGTVYNYRQTSEWSSLDLTETPALTVRNEWAPMAEGNLYFGIGVWVTERIGFAGQGWTSMMISSAASRVDLSSRVGIRYSVNVRLSGV